MRERWLAGRALRRQFATAAARGELGPGVDPTQPFEVLDATLDGSLRFERAGRRSVCNG